MTDNNAEKLLSLADELENLPSRRVKALVGLDGFVDEVVHVVDRRTGTGVDDYIRLTSMAEYGRRIEKAAGLSTNFEMVTAAQKLGGNGPIFAAALVELDYDLTYIGALGMPEIHPVFSDFASRCREVISIANPGMTDAVEFFDSKILCSKTYPFKDVNWQNLRDTVGIDRLVAMLDDADLIGYENWSLLFSLSEIWEHILAEVMPGVKKRELKPLLFLDLADPERRESKDVLHTFDLMKQFREYYQVVLGLNKKEAIGIAQRLGFNGGSGDNGGDVSLQSVAEHIFGKDFLDMLVIHPISESCVITKDGYTEADGPFCKHPKLTAGAGDNFNAGFVFGLCKGFSLEQSLLLGMSVSGFYVRNAKSPNLKELGQFLREWGKGCF